MSKYERTRILHMTCTHTSQCSNTVFENIPNVCEGFILVCVELNYPPIVILFALSAFLLESMYMTQHLEGVIQCHDYSRICKKKVEVVLHSALSSPLDRAELYTPPVVDRFIPTPTLLRCCLHMFHRISRTMTYELPVKL